MPKIAVAQIEVFDELNKNVEKVLLECAKEIKNISSKKLAFVRLNNFGDSSLDFQLFFWTRKTFEVENLKSELRFLIIKKFESGNILFRLSAFNLFILGDFP